MVTSPSRRELPSAPRASPSRSTPLDRRLGGAVVVGIVRSVTALAADLLRTRAFVGGRWIEADSGATFPVLNPATGDVVADVPRLGAAETRRAIEAAEEALPAWKGRPAKERALILGRLATLMDERRDDLAALMVVEQGKPLAEALVEVEYARSFYVWFAEEAKRLDGRLIQSPTADKRIMVTREAIGVTAGITPWNFPAAMPTRKSAPALAVGCTMVLKPAEQTPLTALAIAALAEEAGVPPGVFSVVTGDAEDAPVIGGELTGNPIVRKLGFTGSTEVGKILMRQCAEHVKKVSLELGGNAPLIVFDDADLDLAVSSAIICKYRNSGQTCISANRMLVQDGIYDAFVERFSAAVAALKVADGFTEGVQVGPLIDAPAIEKVERHVADAVERGAEVLVGGVADRRAVLPALRSHGRHRRDGDELRGDVRPGRRDRAVHRRGRGGAHRQRDAIRAIGVLLLARSRPGLACRRGARVRHPRRQHGHDLDRGRSVRGDEGVGNRTRGIVLRRRRLGRAEVLVARRHRLEA